MADSKSQRGGFTLVELLLVLGLILLMLGLALPAISRVRRDSKTLKCLAQLRSHTQIATAYSADNRDHWPYALAANFADPYTGRQVNIRSPHAPHSYAWVGDYWHAPMLESYGHDPFNETLACPATHIRETTMREGASPSRAWSLGRSLSMAMYLDPAALDPRAPTWSPELFRCTRATEVLFPSQKAAIFDGGPFHDERAMWRNRIAHGPPPWFMTASACDGSAAFRNQRDCVMGLVFPRQSGPPRDTGYTTSLRYTPSGVRGLDW